MTVLGNSSTARPARRRKHFIAGAVCPRCHARDSLRQYMAQGVRHVECVSCDYHEVQSPPEVERRQRDKEQVIGVFKPD